jgi:hypothetical protein
MWTRVDVEVDVAPNAGNVAFSYDVSLKTIVTQQQL